MALQDLEPTAEDINGIDALGSCSLCGDWLIPEMLRRVEISDCNTRIATPNRDALQICNECLVVAYKRSTRRGWKAKRK